MAILSIVAEIVVSLLQGLVAIPMRWMGEIALFAVSLGRWKPRWSSEPDTGRGEISFWVGVVATCVIGGVIVAIVFH